MSLSRTSQNLLLHHTLYTFCYLNKTRSERRSDVGANCARLSAGWWCGLVGWADVRSYSISTIRYAVWSRSTTAREDLNRSTNRTHYRSRTILNKNLPYNAYYIYIYIYNSHFYTSYIIFACTTSSIKCVCLGLSGLAGFNVWWVLCVNRPILSAAIRWD